MISTFSPIRASKSSVSDLIFECLASSPGDEGLLLDRGDGYFDYTDCLFESFMLLFAYVLFYSYDNLDTFFEIFFFFSLKMPKYETGANILQPTGLATV